MSPKSIASIVTPADRDRALKAVASVANVGKETADLAALMFGAPLPPSIRTMFNDSLPIFLPDVLEDWHGMLEEDRDYLSRVALMVFDRRLSVHAMAGQWRGGEA